MIPRSFTATKNEFTVSTNRELLNVDSIHAFLTGCYWAEGIPREIVSRSLEHSLCFGVYRGPEQIGLARVVSDYATYAYIMDVYILEQYRGRGLGTWLMSCVMSHPDLQGLRRWNLLTRDAHGLYRKFGFTSPKHPERYMEISHPGMYKTMRPKP